MNVIKYFQSNLPNESCGVMVSGGFIPFPNRSTNPLKSFFINSPQFNQLYFDGKIEAILHSHFNYPHASSQDQLMQEQFDIPFHIYNFKKDKSFDRIGIISNEIRPFINRQFFFGCSDCFTLIHDYLKYNLDFDLKRTICEYGFWRKNLPLIEDTILPQLNVIKLSEVKAYDIIFYKINSKVINHMGVITKVGTVFHHFYNKLSKHYKLNDFQKYAVCGGRIK